MARQRGSHDVVHAQDAGDDLRDHERRRLVELVPGAALDVPLRWQHVRLELPMMQRLTEAVVAEARKRLR